DHRPFANPFLPDFEVTLPEGQPLHASLPARPAAFPPIEYGLPTALAQWGGANWMLLPHGFGLDQALAQWAGSIWSIETPPAPAQADGDGQPGGNEAAAIEVEAATRPTVPDRGEPTAPGSAPLSRIDLDGVPSVLDGRDAGLFAGLSEPVHGALDG